MRCTLVLFSWSALGGISPSQVSRAPGSTVFAISWFASKPGRNLKSSNPSSSLVCKCGNRFSDFQAWRFVPGVMCRPSGCCCLCLQLRPICLSFPQNCPSDTRHLVGQSDCRHLRSLARRQTFQPGTEDGILLGPALQHRMCSLQEQFSQILVTTPPSPGELLLASGG